MTLTTHAAIGVIATTWTQDPYVGFVVGLLSHYISDMIPHGDEFLYWRTVQNFKDKMARKVASVDVALLILFTTIVLSRFSTNWSTTLWVIAGAILPDLLITLHTSHELTKKNGLENMYHRFLEWHWKLHMKIHNFVKTPMTLRTGLLYQFVFVLGVIFWIIS